MMYLKWLLLAPVSLSFGLFSKLICWLLPFFASKEGWLPKWLWWFQTPDNPLDGDSGHWERHPRGGIFFRYIRRVAWCWRNSGYGFDIYVIGAKLLASDNLVIKGDPDISRDPLKNGYCWRVMKRDGKPIYFQIYLIRQWKKWPNRCLRISMGWKLWNFPNLEKGAQYTAFINPFMHCYEAK